MAPTAIKYQVIITKRAATIITETIYNNNTKDKDSSRQKNSTANKSTTTVN